ncbi:MAG TPA: Rap1a/Tai family immunity protein [Caulobacteraceae bacterium]
MAKRLILRLLAGIALTFAPIAEAAPPSGVYTIQDLFDLCADSAPTSQAACDSYVHASIQTAEVLQAAGNGGKLTPLFCPGDQMVSGDLLAVLRLQVTAHPERKTFPAPTVIIAGGAEAYPCPKASAPTAAPAHRRTPARRKRQP